MAQSSALSAAELAVFRRMMAEGRGSRATAAVAVGFSDRLFGETESDEG